MSAERKITIKVTNEELVALVCGHVRDTYKVVAEILFENGTASVTITEEIKPKMSREMRPSSQS